MADYDHEAGARALRNTLLDATGGTLPDRLIDAIWRAALAEIDRQQRAARKELTLADLQEPAAPDDLRMLSAYRTVPSITTDGTAAPVADVAALVEAWESASTRSEEEVAGDAMAAALTRLDEQLRVAAAFANANGHERVKAEARAEAAEADAKALREAWRGLSCPAPFATNRTKTAGECMDREQCGCENRAALAPREGEGR